MEVTDVRITRVPEDERCDECGGTGVLPYDEGSYMKCDTCFGTGSRDNLAQRGVRILAKATVVFDGVFAVHDVVVVEDEKGRREVRMPERPVPDEGYVSVEVAHPLTDEFRAALCRAVLAAYAGLGLPAAAAETSTQALLRAIGRLEDAWRRRDFAEVGRCIEELVEFRDELRLAS